MLKKVLISFLGIFLVQFLLSCLPCDCAGPKSYAFDFDQAIFEKKLTTNPISNEIGFTILLKDDQTILAQNCSKGGFMFSANACSCNDNAYGQLNSAIKSIRIFTLNPLANNIPAGTDVSNLFAGNLVARYNSGNKLYEELDILKNQIYDQNYDFNYYGQKVQLSTQVNFYLKQIPSTTNNKFRVEFTYENGKVLTCITEEFK